MKNIEKVFKELQELGGAYMYKPVGKSEMISINGGKTHLYENLLFTFKEFFAAAKEGDHVVAYVYDKDGMCNKYLVSHTPMGLVYEDILKYNALVINKSAIKKINQKDTEEDELY